MSDAVGMYREELLRWNRRFSLLSRRDPERTLDRLLLECRQGLDQLAAGLGQVDPEAAALIGPAAGGNASAIGAPSRATEADGALPLPAPATVLLLDVGSGNGIPGLPWHFELAERVAGRAELRTALVEPRRKRAWFLERVALRTDPARLRVIEGRWEEGPHSAVAAGDLPSPRLWIVALRALSMPEADLVKHLARHAGPGGPEDRHLTVRFRGPRAGDERAAGGAQEPCGARSLLVSAPAGDPVLRLQVRWYPSGTLAVGGSP